MTGPEDMAPIIDMADLRRKNFFSLTAFFLLPIELRKYHSAEWGRMMGGGKLVRNGKRKCPLTLYSLSVGA